MYAQRMNTTPYSTLPQMLRWLAQGQGDQPAQFVKDADGRFQPVSLLELYLQVRGLAAALIQRGLQAGEPVGLIAENRQEWLVADLGIQSAGAADVPRGNDSTTQELAYILGFTGCRFVFVEGPAQAEKIRAAADKLPELKALICFDPVPEGGPWPVWRFKDLLDEGLALDQDQPGPVESAILAGKARDLATIIFTSGTTGEPKGVMLCHDNFLHQVRHVPDLIDVGPGDRWLAVLPVWHSFERIMQYVALGQVSALAYSKPIGKIMLADMAQLQPTWMASVPRIWEAVKSGIYANVRTQPPVKQALFHFFVSVGAAYQSCRNRVLGRVPRFTRRWRGLDAALGVIPWLLLMPFAALGSLLVFKTIRAKLGGRFKAGISGGGALPRAVDDFFNAAGIQLLEGYGITETAPVLSVRDQHHPVPGTVGPVFPGTSIQIRDPEGRVLPPGQKGVIWAKGPQVMLGYYKKPEWTAKVIDQQGFFNTGDLGLLTWDNEIKILGRVKDTIVLLGGENVEPLPIENKLKENELIAQAVVVGQDQKYLGALLVPDWAALETRRADLGLSGDLGPNNPGVRALYEGLVKAAVSAETGFKSFERVNRFVLLPKAFEIGRELSAKQEVKRFVIAELYKKEIAGLFT